MNLKGKPIQKFQGKKIAVVGLGVEGLSSVQYLRKHGAKVTGLDQNQGEDYLNDLNHFDLVKLLHSQDKRYCPVCENLVSTENLNKIYALLDTEFRPLMSQERLTLIKKCLKIRFQELTLHT